MRDRYSETSFAPIATMIAILVVGVAVAIGCVIKYSSDEKPAPQSTQSEQLKDVVVEQPKTEQPTNEPKPRVWRGADYGLPAGVVVGGEQDDENPALNWISIQQPDGHMTIAHNIDGRLWNAMNNGDIIE